MYGIIQRHEGTIKIKSAIDKGTVFFLQFPIPTAAIDDSLDSIQPSVSGPLHRQLRILLVDDEARVQDVIRHYLERDGHTVETAAHGVESLSKFDPGKYDLVITDRAMPEMNGEMLALAIKKAAPTTPVVLLSGTGELINASGNIPDGFRAVISKPVTIAELRRTLARLF